MAIDANQQPSIRPVVLAEISVAMSMVGAILSVAASTVKNDLAIEGKHNHLVTEGAAFKLTTEGA
tara:strand:+ start:854 stop:1048 length:195 start_codon:yes stop_codon:yes gene_type:complete